MRFTCPACTKSYRLTREHLGASGGAKIKCPNCAKVVRVQLGEGDTLHAELATASGAHQPNPARTTGAQRPAARQTAAAGSGAPIWHVAVGKSAQGPMTVAQMQALIDKHEIDLNALGWRKGMANWTRLSEIAELAGQLRAALSAPAADPAGQDHGGDAPTVMADVVPGGEDEGDDFHVASTLKPTAGRTTGGALPRGRAAPGLQAGGAQAQPAAQAKPQPAAQAKPQPAAQAKPQPAAQAKPQPAAQAKPQPAQPQPAAQAKPQPAAAKTSGGMFPSSAADAGPGAAAHSASFFDAGDALADVELALPDPNKHKPTKEEYQNLLQEFSVMFRLDKRGKRQKVAIAVVLSLLVVGVIAFGVILYLQGQQRQALIRDSKTILAVFSLDYQTSVTVNLTREAEEEAEKTGQKVEGAPAGTRTTSRLAEALRSKIKEKRVQRTAGGGGGGGSRQPVRIAAGGGGNNGPKLTKEQIEAAQAAAKEAMARSLGSVGGRQERVVGAGLGTSQVTNSQLRGMCSAAAGDLRACSRTYAGEAPFTASVHINTAGNIDKVDAKVGGSRNAELSTCALSKLSKKRFGLQDKETTYNCQVN
ncbi:MAG: zinc-ribbon domain-containing protein [Deltaproteobacteria bacterium]|nr:zinc-ribbon domain-containing protein [Deltaproteobacteria bacterium]